MGNCNCCCKNPRCSTSQTNIKSIKKQIEKSEIDDNIHSIQPMLKASGDESPTDEENTNEEHISSMFLCDDTTIDLCPISHRIINILSLYHSFINNYTISDITNNNICSIISTALNDYDLLNLRDDYHHIITYHDTNTIFMQQLFDELQLYNCSNGITDLSNINSKLEIDETTHYYFGHINDDEISMIQCLNQIHHDCTYEYTGINCNNNCLFRGDTMRQIYDKSGTDSNGIDCDYENDMDYKNDDVDIDIKYNKNEKEFRKIGKLNLKEINKKLVKKYDKTKVKPQTIHNDDSWLKKDGKNKKSKHVMSNSIQMLGSTKLVSNNPWKKSLDSLQENCSNNSFDLTSFDVSVLAGDSPYDEYIGHVNEEKTRDINDINGGYNREYQIDRV